jgi:hypothetical protein
MLVFILTITAGWLASAQNPVYFTPDILPGICNTDSLTSSTTCELHGAVNVSITQPSGPVILHGSEDTRLQLAAITFSASPAAGKHVFMAAAASAPVQFQWQMA